MRVRWDSYVHAIKEGNNSYICEMAYRKYDTCFFERYAILALQTLLGHKFDGLVNEDRPDLQSPDGRTLGIEVTRAMEQGREQALQMLKDLSGLTAVDNPSAEDRAIVSSGYGYGIRRGRYIGGMELGYWKTAKPLRDIIANKVGKVTSGFYGEFSEYGLFVFCRDLLTEAVVEDAIRYTMSLQKDADTRYARLFLFDAAHLYACNIEDDIAFSYRITDIKLTSELRHKFYFGALKY